MVGIVLKNEGNNLTFFECVLVPVPIFSFKMCKICKNLTKILRIVSTNLNLFLLWQIPVADLRELAHLSG